MTVTVKTMDSQRCVCRIQWFHFTASSSPPRADSRLLARPRRSARCPKAELPRVLGVQPVPSLELHRVGSDDAADRIAAEQVIQHVEAEMPPGGTHRDEPAIDVGPQRQARAGADGFELPPHVEAAPV